MVYSLESEAALPPTVDGEMLVVSFVDDDGVREMSISVDDIMVSIRSIMRVLYHPSTYYVPHCES